ncbi:hypothetical protein UY3_13099 [Chelonia mydas]|uniref:Myb/SANT-like DNA-binding domain-containing protein n=1 Tax=Chelonia mydas TaxID=8469 RepID=M7AW76_CHEMY|nr:hypothetical protein UY3_13099 [Chelonia mydas]
MIKCPCFNQTRGGVEAEWIGVGAEWIGIGAKSSLEELKQSGLVLEGSRGEFGEVLWWAKKTKALALREAQTELTGEQQQSTHRGGDTTMHWPGRQEKARKLLNFNFLFGQQGKLQVSAEVTMQESQNCKRAPAWTEREVRDLIALWGDKSVLSELRYSFQNAKTFVKISQGMKDTGHNRDPKQCRVKLKELVQA